ncbi:IgGFc-binding protein [Myxococcota bacterium]|nr:IgGFc-binding protein [Myxococcota bacterium]MBU1381305.1 IgGFc-binding protein [Myxococcota bacterium]MBU1498348.1 IgGFc-binding protein [Myxococcota bacterium]
MFKKAILLSSLCAFAALSCEDGKKETFNNSNNDSGTGDCTPGERDCDGLTALYCNSIGQWDQELCQIGCSYETGCMTCTEGETYCQENTVMVCDANGDLQTDHDCDEMEYCVGGECVTRCHPALLTESNVGCEFWAVDLDNEAYDMMGNSNDAAAQQFAVAVANTNDYPVRVEIYRNSLRFEEGVLEVPVMPENGVGNPVTVPAHGLVQIDLPQREVDGCMGQNSTYTKYSGSGTFASSHAYRLVSNAPVVAYQFNPIIQQFSNDASLLIPTQALGKNYYVMGYPTSNPCGDTMFPMESIPDHTSVTIIGTEEETEVTIYPTHPIMASGGDSGIAIPEIQAGSSYTFTLGRMDVVNFESLQFIGGTLECISHMPEQNGDFTGTKIISTKPVAVFSSNERGSVGGEAPPPPDWDDNSCCTDHLEQQLFPTRSLGWKYVISRSPVRSTHSTYREPDIYKVLGTVDNTTVTTSLPSPDNQFTLGAGEARTFYAYDGFTMESTGGAIMVGQYIVSQGYVPGGIGDPTFIVFPAVDQHREDFVFLIPTSFQDNYMVLAAPDSAQVTIDGNGLGEFQTVCVVTPIGIMNGVNYTQYTCPMDEGVHNIVSTEPVGLTVYGYYNVGSYGYPGGADVKVINPVE